MPRPREKNGGDIKGLQAEPSSRACTISRRRKMSERTANLSHFNVEVPRANNAHSPQKLLERESSDVSCTTNARGRKEGRKEESTLPVEEVVHFFFFHVKRGRYFPQLAKLAGTLLKTNARGWCLTSPRHIVGGKKLRKSVPVLQAKFEARATNLIRRCHSENGNDRIGCNLNPIYIPPIRSRTRFSRTSVIKVLERVLLEPAVALNTRDA